MIHVAIALWITVIGLCVVLPATRWLGPTGAGALAPAIGISVYVIVGSFLASMGGFSVVTALLASSALGIGALALGHHATTLEPRSRASRQTIAGATVGAILVSLVALNVHATRFTVDSYAYLSSASVLDSTGDIDSIPNDRLVIEQVAVPLLHATGWLDSTGYSPALSPLMAASMFLTFAWLTNRGLARSSLGRRSQALLIGSALLLLATTNRVVFNITYVNGHMLFATLLLAGVGITWLALVEGEHRHLHLAAIAVAALALVRAEAFLVVTLFLLPAIADRRLTTRDRVTLALPAAITTVLWFGIVLPPHAPGSGVGTSLFLGNAALAAAVLGYSIVASRARRLWLVVKAPYALIPILGAALLWQVGENPSLLVSSVSALATNLAHWGYWGSFWYVMLPLLAAAILIGSVESDRMWVHGIVGFFTTLVLLAYLREGAFRVGGGDSGNRMLMHIVPIMVAFVVLAVGRVWANREIGLSSSKT